MAHPLSRPPQSGALPHFERLWRTLLAPGIDLGTKFERLCEVETEALDLSTAFLSRIDLDDETERFQIVYGPQDELTAETTVPLSTTYCRKTIAEPSGTLVVSDAADEGWDGDPAFERFGFETYVGTTVAADVRTGTVVRPNDRPDRRGSTG